MEQGFIFDCYGTIVKPISNLGAKAFLNIIEDKKAWIHRLMTTPVSIQEHLSSSEFKGISPEIKNTIIKLLQSDTTTLYEDAQRILEHCISQKISFCILSNLSADYKDNIDNLIIAPYKSYHNKFFKVLYSCNIGYQKPEKQAYQFAIDFLGDKGISKDHITMIGDNPKYDYLRPKKLGLQAKRIDRNNKPHNYPAGDVITSFDELV